MQEDTNEQLQTTCCQPIKDKPIKHICDICGRKFRSDNGYSVHKFKHTLIGKLVCPVCGVDFKEADMRVFHAHIAKHYKDEKYDNNHGSKS